MALSNKQKQADLRKRKAELGLKEMRGVWVTAGQEKPLKAKIKEWLKQDEQSI